MPDTTTGQHGPVMFVVLAFETDRPSPKILEALEEVIEDGAVSLLDLVFVSRSADGEVVEIEIEDVSEEYGFGGVELEASGLAGHEDLDAIAAGLEPGTSAAILVIEHAWARRLAATIGASGGTVAAVEHIPATTVTELLDTLITEGA